MRALQQTSLNGPQDLRLITDVRVPSPGPGEVLIRVTAAGVNFVDISQARGTFAGGPRPPYLAGIEAAGEIAAVGDGVTGLEPGARVIGVGIGCGAFAEYTAIPAVAVLPLPAGWTEEQSLGLMVSWPTALAALRPLGRIAAGETVLIHAAAGGTGQAAVKMARHYGDGGAALGASLAAARRVTGRVVVYGTAGGEAAVTNWELVYRH
jgi:NADPH:quinone reductase